ncbi:MAG: DEAD/DEAH box helicase [Bacteroidetes bacterium]|nr:DEAD/DEAH box helicase [Bacteroidota bacterium]
MLQIASLEANIMHPELILLSNTGSGKTLAFLLAMLSHIDENNPHTQVLIMVLLARLYCKSMKYFENGNSFKVTLCYGGHEVK